MKLKDRAISGVFWNGLSKVTVQFVQLSIMAILARLLMPSDFGIVGTTLIFTRFITLINEMGIAATVVQRKNIDEDDLSTLFVASLLLGVLLALILFFAAPLLANFFSKQILSPVLKLSSLTLIIGSFGVIHKALLNRNLDFKSIAFAEMIGVAAYGMVSIILAKLGYGVWSIVWGNIALHLVSSILYWLKIHWRPRLVFYYSRFRELINFGLNYFGTNLVNYANINLASLIIGKFLGMATLGIYELSNNVTNQTVGRLSFIIGKVMFPTLSKMQDDNERFANAFLKVLQVIAIIAFPMLIGIFVIAKPLVLVVFGQKWEACIFTIQVLAAASIIRSVGRTVGYVLQAKGRSDIEFKWNIVYMTVFLTFLLLFKKFGLNGVLLSIVLITGIGSPIIQKISFSLIDLTLTKVIKTLAPILFCAIMMGVTVSAMNRFVLHDFSNFQQLIVSIPVGAISYAIFLLLFGNSRVKEIRDSLADSVLGEKLTKVKRQIRVNISGS